jgi:hypothetical protein
MTRFINRGVVLVPDEVDDAMDRNLIKLRNCTRL